MELKSKEALIIEKGFDSLVQFHENEIIEITNIDESYYELRLSISKSLTFEDFKRIDIEKELKCIKEINELKEKLFLSNNYLLVVSNRIKLNITDK